MTAGIVLGVGIGWFVLNPSAPASPYQREPVAYRRIVQEIAATGSITPTARITLRFQMSGTADSIPMEVGDLVSKGDLLIALDPSEGQLAVSSAQAELAAAQADYAQALAGSTSQSIEVAAAAVGKATADLEQSMENLESQKQLGDQAVALAELRYGAAVSDQDHLVEQYDLEVNHAYENAIFSIDDALTHADDALREIDLLLAVNHEPTDPHILSALQAHSSALYTDAVNDYKTVYALFLTLSDEVQRFDATQTEAITEALSETATLLENVEDLIENVKALVEGAPILEGFDDQVRADIGDDLAAQEASMLSAQSNLSNQAQAVESLLHEQEAQLSQGENAVEEAEEALHRAQLEKETNVTQAQASVSVYESLLKQAKASLGEVKAGPRGVDLAALQAAITRAQAQLDIARHDLSLTSLYAPAQGVITEIYFEEGEALSAADNVLQLVTTDYHILANIPESDIAKLSVGDPVNMTLDAFAYDQMFEGSITEINPAETVVEGVIYYQVEAAFRLPYDGIKPGMTANMDIVTAEEDHVLAVPLRALRYEKDRIYVELFDEATQTVHPVDVQLGIRDDQYVHIVSGLKEGDDVVTLTKE